MNVLGELQLAALQTTSADTLDHAAQEEETAQVECARTS